MINFYQVVKESLHTNRFEYNEIICFEYSCPIDAENISLFSRYDYVVHVLSGKKTYKTIDGEWTLTPGNTMYFKKGAEIVHQYFDEQYCMLGFILTDDIIREVFNEVKGKQTFSSGSLIPPFTGVEVRQTEWLDTYFNSMLAYFRGKNRPPDALLLLKVKELLHILWNSDVRLQAYFKDLSDTHKPSLKQIMESNYCFNLKLEEYADLSHRSLSTFKRDFQKEFGEAPSKWLQKKRISHAANLIVNTRMNMSQIALESGFEDLSHFSRLFRKTTGVKPSEYKKGKELSVPEWTV